jgi:hypothetical protein
MKISAKAKKILRKEFEFAIKKMEEDPQAENKLYYFTAIFSMIQRIFNVEFDPELVFTHFVLTATYTAANQRLTSMKSGAEQPLTLAKNFFPQLVELTKELWTTIEKDENPYEVLKQISLLAFSTSGNGFYLQQKGVLVL